MIPAGLLQMGAFDMFSSVFWLFFVLVLIIIVIGAARSLSYRGSVQRPLSEATSFPPPPPPDTVLVKCDYCGTEQKWSEKCLQCGAPLPRPRIP